MTATTASGPAFTALQPRLSQWILDHLESSLFLRSTPVQASTIPLLLKHKDVIVEAVTGSGKTLAYLLPLLAMMTRSHQGDAASTSAAQDDAIQALVLLPTRELAIQVFGVLSQLIESAPEAIAASMRPQLVVGGGKTRYHGKTPQQPKGEDGEEEDDGVGGSNTPQQDLARLRKMRNNIIIGTPGRVEELFKKSIVRGKVKGLQLLVLDEADRLLDLGFFDALTSILSSLPKQRRTALLSATMTDSLDQLVRVGLRNPVRITVRVELKKSATSTNGKAGVAAPTSQDARMPATLQNFFLVTPRSRKVAQLVRLLQYEPTRHNVRKIIVFFATCRQVEYFYKVMSSMPELKNCRVYSLHGKQNPARRSTTYRSFVDDVSAGSTSSQGGASVLLCTDVASRGLDLPDLDLVVQFDAPLDPKVFNHRIGRTARAGRSGRAICMLSGINEVNYMQFLSVRGIRGSIYPPVIQQDGVSGDLTPAVSAESYESSDDPFVGAITSSLRQQNLADLAIHDLFVLALVSYVRAYGKHEARFIFPLKDLVSEIEDVARSWGGVRLPKMGELKGRKGSISHEGSDHTDQDMAANKEGWLSGRVSPSSWTYKDPAKETARQSKLSSSLSNTATTTLEKASSDPTPTATAPPSLSLATKKRMRLADESSSSAWSDQKKRRERRDERREKRGRKRKAIKAAREAASQSQTQAESTGHGGKDRDDSETPSGEEEEEDDWAADERLARRERRLARRAQSIKAGQRGVLGWKKSTQGGGGDEGDVLEMDSGGELEGGEGSDAGAGAGGGGGGFFDGL